MSRKTLIEKFGTRPTFETVHLRLKEVTMEDSSALEGGFTCLEKSEQNWFHMRKVKSWLEIGQRSSFWWAACSKATGELVGYCQFHDVLYSGEFYSDIEGMDVEIEEDEMEDLAFEGWSLVIVIFPAFRRHGYGSEIAKVVISFLFEQLHVPKFDVELDEEGHYYQGAAQFCLKCGLRDYGREQNYEGISPFLDETHHAFGLSREDFEKKGTNPEKNKAGKKRKI